MSTTPISQQKPAEAVLICAACGKIFPYKNSYHVDPKLKCFDGGIATFGKDCYPPSRPLVNEMPEADWKKAESTFSFAFITKDDKVNVYHLKGEYPDEVRHDPKRVKVIGTEKE